MNQIASLNPSDVLDKTAKFFRVMERAGVPWENYQLPIDDKEARRNLAEYLNAGCPKINGTQLSGYLLAYNVLGDDFITPEEIARARGLTYSDEVLKRYEKTLPSSEELRWCKENGFLLTAGTPQEMSLLEIRDLNPRLFYSQTDGWYSEERFAREDKVGVYWLAVRKSPVPNSMSKTWDEQQELVVEPETVPNAPEAVWAVTTYKEVRNIFLLPDVYARTSSVDSGGCRVDVGLFAGFGLDVYCHWVDRRVGDLGVLSFRKF